ncbi:MULTISPECIES: alkene reductase [unclassified Achromobacter]|uniref:alkene reductase n=1 Tax=unclassified Achromobacter TaxID=2626865 RepID=UPI000B518A99|nr:MULTISPECIES: alkene reductase [unclassified Achromobacter]OWT70208.1 alkene reductase [Achromobacter sp. HZ34]OWT71748.1 alkene reductase [Achromobacter sp. HZ28]
MSNLFQPFNLSGVTLQNRVVMAPMTRSRAPQDIATETIALYYAQRATAGLIVSEGTPISREGQGYLFNPGIFTPEQIAGWRLTTQSVHALGGRIFAQLWHVGRVSHPSIQEDGKAPVSASSKLAEGATAFGYDDQGQPALIPVTEPRQLATEEVPRIVQDFADAAANAIEAGFDGVEIHGANGYLFEQFLNPKINDRKDRYAADTMDDRLRFALEAVDAVIARIGRERVGIRLSPYGKLFDMPHYDEIDETYTALVTALGQRGLAYVHIMDQSGFAVADTIKTTGASVSDRIQHLLTVFRAVLPHTALILAGGMTRERAERLITDGVIDLAGFGQPFISNPDLVARLRNGWTLAEPDRSTYYGGDARGLIDYAPHAAA